MTNAGKRAEIEQSADDQRRALSDHAEPDRFVVRALENSQAQWKTGWLSGAPPGAINRTVISIFTPQRSFGAKE